MRKLVCSLVILASAIAFAEKEKVATVQIDNMTGLAESCTKLGEMLGNPMVSSMVTGSLAKNPATKYFGPMRADDGVSVVLGLYLDAAKIGCTNGNDEAVACTVVYPVVGGKAKFLKLHKDAREQDGVIRVDDDEFTAFSADGKWATKAETAALAKTALADVEVAQKKMGGDIARVRVNARGIAALEKIFEEAGKTDGKSAEWLAAYYNIWIRGAKAAVGAVKVSDAGLDFIGSVKVAADSTLARFGKTSLADDPLKFAGKDALIASATAPGFMNTWDRDTVVRIVEMLKKELGVDADKFLAVTGKGDDLKIAADVRSAIAYFKAAETNGLKKAFEQKRGDKDFATRLQAEYMKIAGKTIPTEPSASGCNFSFALKGYTAGCTMSERFGKVLPKIAEKKPFKCDAMSYVAILNALVPSVLESLDEETRAMAQPLLVQLPKDGKGGLASAFWREDDTFKALCRISADEIKGIGSIVNVGISFAMMQAMNGAATGEEDDADDEDGDADDED